MKKAFFKISVRCGLFFLSTLFFFLKPTPLYAKGSKYKVEFYGVDSLSQLQSLKEVSALVQYRKNLPRSLAALRHRAERDVPSLIDVLHAYGYYDACVNTKAYRLPNGKMKMIVNVNKGEPYLLSKFDLVAMHDYQVEEYDLNDIKLEKLGIKLQKPAKSTSIVNAEKELSKILSQNGFPLAEIKTPDILVDQAQKTVAVSFKVDEGPFSQFGDVTIQNQGKVKTRFIKNRILWKKGEVYNSEKVLETEKKLYDSGLFSTVSISHGNAVDKEGYIPLTIDLTDSKYRSLTLGGNYTTTWSGFGGTASWQNRNLFRSGLNLKLSYSINQKKQDAGLEFLFPDFFSPKQQLIIDSAVNIRNVMPTYREKGIKTRLYVERELSRYFNASLGAKFDQFKMSESLNDGYFSLIGTPAFIKTQSSDKLLINPVQGGWASLNITPYFSLNNNSNTFSEVKLEGSAYQFIIPSKRIILAMNMVFGTLFGSTTFLIPPSYRFYAGSPNHLRGYPYQKVSPLNRFGKEEGGRSLFLWSIEPRFTILKYVQIVGFFDVGNVYTGIWPKWNEALAKSLGVGIRYFSFIGPLRLDIGFPMNRRNNIKRKPQIYFSIGQAF